MTKRITIGSIVSGGSGDPDTKGTKVAQITGAVDNLSIGTVIYVDVKDEEMVTITADEYNELLSDRQMLCALEAAGVDNWHGYEEAQEMIEEWDAE